jgi:dTDP-4-dehydrorhamnose 3,5-epimerase-like enzyme
MLKNILIMKQVRVIELKNFDDASGNIVVMESESENVPFKIKRVFTVSSQKNGIRGRHAHKHCAQLLICSNGSIKVTCDNGKEIFQFMLNRPNVGLLISAGVWAKQEYISENSILTVICNQKYSENDYIRSYKNFLKFVNLGESNDK